MTAAPPFQRILVANRGEIACRILATLRRLGIDSVAVYSEADAGALHRRLADVALPIGPAPVAESYLRADATLAAARETGAEAIHPGYGLLSENADFARGCEAAGIVFLGPTPRQIDDFGLKDRAREIAVAAGVPVCAGTEVLPSLEAALAAAEEIGFPLLLKATAGGGGIGMELCRDPSALAEAFDRVTRQSAAHFGSGGVFLERFVEHARHVEVQIFGDGTGHVLSLGERDCSLQRRRQKVIEESPAPGLSEELRGALAAAARDLAASVRYRSAGTVEFLVEPGSDRFHFLEVNTRLQVEHGVTEARYGVDLVEWMIRVGAGEGLPDRVPAPHGHAIEARLYAEDPARDFQPCTGVLSEVHFPEGVRVDSGVDPGTEVSPFYDPMLAKVVAAAPSRAEAVSKLASALGESRLGGIGSNLSYLSAVLRWPTFLENRHHTRSLEGFEFETRTISVEAPGIATTVQAYPGRLGYWAVGVPPSGPMDSLAFRIANRIVGNPEGTAALEITAGGPTLLFGCDATIALAGATVEAEIDGEPAAGDAAHPIRAGQSLRLGRVGEVQGSAAPAGLRAYLAIRGGLDVPNHLGSRATFALGRFGGHAGRALIAGDTLPLGNDAADPPLPPDEAEALSRLHPLSSAGDTPVAWRLRVLDGPHGHGFFTDEDLREFFTKPFEVHYQSARTGIRLVGPRPRFARTDGGDAGLHPSNLHDNAYAQGAVDYTGDMPVVLGPDGPSLGGFVCPAVVIHADRWKLGQLRAGDSVHFDAVSDDDALAIDSSQDRAIRLRRVETSATAPAGAQGPRDDGILARHGADGAAPEVVIRRAGDRYLLVEFGPNHLDLELRIRVQQLYEAIRGEIARGEMPGIVDLTPGVRSLQVHFDPSRIDRRRLIDSLEALERGLSTSSDVALPSRIVRLPLSWDDPQAARAVAKYAEVVRDDAPWTPSNIEFIRRINGLASEEDVRRIVFDATYLVLGLGDVYLGAPVATPLDPRHRLVTTKYNPARTWTPENAVGIGGAYMCVYGMEGPGGYQLVGRTIPVWSTHGRWKGAAAGEPWLLRFFDRIQFFPVSPEELLERRHEIECGTGSVEIEDGSFEPARYREFLAGIADDAVAFRERQQEAFEAERHRWVASGELEAAARAERAVDSAPEMDAIQVEDGVEWVTSPLGAQVLDVQVKVGDPVQAGSPLVVVSAMKTETTISAPGKGVVENVACSPGQILIPGSPLVAIRGES